MPSKFKIGDTAYEFDINRRVYRRNVSGQAYGGPIYREHWRPVIITGESGKSWLLDRYPLKIGKAKAEAAWKTAAEVDDACWVDDHRHRIAASLHHCSDVEVLKEIARIIGYTPEETPDAR